MSDRLTVQEVQAVTRNLRAYDADLVRKTGLTLRQVAERAAGGACRSEECLGKCRKAAVVRVTSGEGVIEGFAEAVRAVLHHVGAEAFVTTAGDVAGLAEAVEKDAGAIFMADDDRFIALNPALRKIADNAEATARGYVSALEAMAGGLARRRVLVIGGAGRVGWNAVRALREIGSQVTVFDPDQRRLESLARGRDIAVARDIEKALGSHELILDASPAAGIIQLRHVTPETLIAAPGIPLGLTPKAHLAVEGRLIHDSLEIGVAAMWFLAGGGPEKAVKAGG